MIPSRDESRLKPRLGPAAEAASRGQFTDRAEREFTRDSLAGGEFQQSGHGDEPPIHDVGREPELFERDHAEDRLGPRLPEYNDRRLHALPKPDADPRHRVLDLPAVSQDERPVLLGHDADTFEHVARDTRIRGTSVHERLDWLEPLPGAVTHLYGDPKVTHPRICSI